MSVVQDCLVMRADASPSIGIGHVMRCFALAQAWQQAHGAAIFATSAMPEAVQARLAAGQTRTALLKAERGSLADAAETAALAQRERARWIVVDGYHFVPGYQRVLRESGASVLCIDDTADLGPYDADLVLNQNVHAVESLYAHRAPQTRLLLGPRYSLLRPEFVNPPPAARPLAKVARRILITFGGSDPANGTRLAIESLRGLAGEDFEAVVVVGGSNAKGPELESAASWSNGRLRFVYNVENMPELMAWADMAICAAGSTTLELARIGVPMITVVLADNQEPGAARMGALNAAVNLGRIETVGVERLSTSIRSLMNARERREQLSEEASRMVDGQGAQRVVRALEDIRLRPADFSDARLLFEWVNDPAVRSASFQSDPIVWEDHLQWFQQKLADPAAVLFLAENLCGEPLGVARFQIEKGVAVISISVAPSACGKGLGRRIIDAASRRILERSDVDQVHALMRPENIASARAFLAAGFREDLPAPTPYARLFFRKQEHS